MKLLFICLALMIARISFAAEADTAAAEPAKLQVENVRKITFSLYAYYNTADRMTFPSLSVNNNGSSSSSAVIYNMAGVGGVGAEVSGTEPDSWGWNGGAALDGKRTLSAASGTANGVNFGDIGSGGTVSVLTVYGNAIYRWDRVYIPFGLNITLPKMESDPNAGESLSVTGGLGTQGGVGVHICNHFSVEAVTRIVALKLTGTLSSGNSISGTGYESGTSLLAKFDF